jgi:hypothetical protein
MDQVTLLSKQTEDAYQRTNKLLTSIPYEKWNTLPPVVESTISWQVGHLVLSFYFHTIMVIRGHQKEILEKVPMKEYNQLFFMGSLPENVAAKTTPEILFQQLTFLQEKSLQSISALSVSELDLVLEPTSFPHPVAKTKYEALDWNIKHTMWHCGQLAILKRIVHERYDFLVKK